MPSWPVGLRHLCSSVGIVNLDLAGRIEAWRERMHVEDESTVGRVYAKIRREARAGFNGWKGAEEAADRASGDNQPTRHRVPKQFDFHVDSRADGRERLVQHARLEMNRHQDVDKNPPLRAKIPSTTRPVRRRWPTVPGGRRSRTGDLDRFSKIPTMVCFIPVRHGRRVRSQRDTGGASRRSNRLQIPTAPSRVAVRPTPSMPVLSDAPRSPEALSSRPCSHSGAPERARSVPGRILVRGTTPPRETHLVACPMQGARNAALPPTRLHTRSERRPRPRPGLPDQPRADECSPLPDPDRPLWRKSDRGAPK